MPSESIYAYKFKINLECRLFAVCKYVASSEVPIAIIGIVEKFNGCWHVFIILKLLGCIQQ